MTLRKSTWNAAAEWQTEQQRQNSQLNETLQNATDMLQNDDTYQNETQKKDILQNGIAECRWQNTQHNKAQ